LAGENLDSWTSIADEIRKEGRTPALVAAYSEYEIEDAPDSEVLLFAPQEVERFVLSKTTAKRLLTILESE
jgi:hypothetical protein